MGAGREGPVLTIHDIIHEHYGQSEGFDWFTYINNGIPKSWHHKSCRDRVYDIHRFIIRQFIEMVVDDIINENVQFDINLRNEVLLSLLIADRERSSKRYRYRIEKRGHDYIPYGISSGKIIRKTNRFVVFRLHKSKWRKLKKQIQNGHEYDKAPKLVK